MAQWRDAVEEILAYHEHKLSAWESDFFQSMQEWSGHPTERQGQKMCDIAERLGVDLDDDWQ
jgi:hypothetical protein